MHARRCLIALVAPTLLAAFACGGTPGGPAVTEASAPSALPAPAEAETIALAARGDLDPRDPEALATTVAHALELLQRPVQAYYLPPGEAGRIKQNWHLYVTMGRHDGTWPAAPQTDDDHALGQLLAAVDRSPEALTELYDTVRPILLLTLSQREYQQAPVSFYVETLRDTYRQITGTPGWQGVFDEMTAALEIPRDGSTYCTPVQCGASLRRLADPATLEALHSPCEETDDTDYAEYCGYRNAYWFYAFWYRRHVEGNVDAVHAILEDVHRTYVGTLAGR